ncbi:hypothetical protein [Paraeggerthella sp.]|uniref:hypothetical protein n=1 Tax=Paraeggerthella sp. TaxID=2897350 RepID=UPI003AB50E31
MNEKKKGLPVWGKVVIICVSIICASFVAFIGFGAWAMSNGYGAGSIKAGQIVRGSNVELTCPSDWNKVDAKTGGMSMGGVVVPTDSVYESPEGSALTITDASAASISMDEIAGTFNKGGGAMHRVRIGDNSAMRIEGTDGGGSFFIVLIVGSNDENVSAVVGIAMSESEFESNYDTYNSIIESCKIA